MEKPQSRHVLHGPEVMQDCATCYLCVCVCACVGVYFNLSLSECDFVIKSDVEVTED